MKNVKTKFYIHSPTRLLFIDSIIYYKRLDNKLGNIFDEFYDRSLTVATKTYIDQIVNKAYEKKP